MRNQKILTMVQRRQTEEGEKMSDQKILMTWSPGVREERQRQMMLARSQKILKMTNRQRSLRIQKEKETLEGHLNLSKVMWKRIQKEILTQQKEQDQVDPVMWDCPFCEDKKYADNLEYLVHLQKAHKCNLPGHAVKKEVKIGKPGKHPKGPGKR